MGFGVWREVLSGYGGEVSAYLSLQEKGGLRRERDRMPLSLEAGGLGGWESELRELVS